MRVLTCIAFYLGLATTALGAQMPLNPDVRQDNLDTTTCLRGWTRTVRPPVSYTGEIKRRMMAEIGVPPEGELDVILDHRIPIVLGGSPDDPRNFILQPADESKDKDRVEVCLARTVCAGHISLDQAQRAIWENWRTAGRFCQGFRVIQQ
jgi:hypothetical protein